jgi:hypothetical protein
MTACSNAPYNEQRVLFGGLPYCRGLTNAPCCVDYIINQTTCSYY